MNHEEQCWCCNRKTPVGEQLKLQTLIVGFVCTSCVESKDLAAFEHSARDEVQRVNAVIAAQM